MKAFRYDIHGDLVPCEDFGEQFREPGMARQSFEIPPPRSKRERRRWARRGSGRHRHRARPVREVQEHQPAQPLSLTVTVFRGHEFRNDRGVQARLYLADGARVTGDDEDRLNAVMRGSPQPGKASGAMTPDAVLEAMRASARPMPDTILVAADLFYAARQMFESEFSREFAGVTRMKNVLRVERDGTLPLGRWKLARSSADR